MAQVHCWDDLIKAAKATFPETNLNRLLLARDNLGVLVREVAHAHELTLADRARRNIFVRDGELHDGPPELHFAAAANA